MANTQKERIPRGYYLKAAKKMGLGEKDIVALRCRYYRGDPEITEVLAKVIVEEKIRTANALKKIRDAHAIGSYGIKNN